MKQLFIILCFLTIACNNKKDTTTKTDIKVKTEVLKIDTQIVEASCGQCKFGLTSQKGCDLAVRINGKSYFVDGSHIDDHGDAHDKKIGFCEVIRKAKISGKIVDNRFKATSFKIIEEIK